MEESSFADGSGLSPEEQAAADEAKVAADEAARAEAGNASGVAGSDLPTEGDAAEGGEDGGDAEASADAEDDGSDEAGSDEHNPAADQSPVATEAQEAIIGDPGLRNEQQPQQEAGSPSNVNTPNRTSAPPPEAQSGVPLPEDRAAGVEPGE